MGEQRPFGGLITYEKALDKILDSMHKMEEEEEVDINDAKGRVLAEDVTSEMNVPPFRRAAMDGFAVKAEETYGAGKFDPVELKVVGNIHAGDSGDVELEENGCVQIATGAPMPDDADAVVMVEVTEKEGEKVKIKKPVHPEENVSPKGEDIERDEVVLEGGTVLSHAKIGALAAMGMSSAVVYRKPRIAIIPTGDEVKPLDKELEPGQIYDVDSYTLSSLVKSNGGVPVRSTVVHDTIEGLKDEIEGRSGEVDMILFSGGSSVGDKDILVDALESLGEIRFHGIKLKPGKPTLFGEVQKTPLVGMPGYPTSCLNTGLRLIKPAIRKMARLPDNCERTVEAELEKRIVSSLGRQQYMTVMLDGGKATPAYKQSGAITSMADADGYFEIPENVELVDKGEEVQVTLF